MSASWNVHGTGALGQFETLAELVKQSFQRPIPLRERPLNVDSCLIFAKVRQSQIQQADILYDDEHGT